MGLSAAFHNMMLAQRGHLVGWIPVFLACGIGLYFSVRVEPDLVELAGIAGLGLVLFTVARKLPEATAPLITAFALITLGFLLAAWRAHAVEGPVLGWRYYGPVEGRIIGMDRSQSDAVRLTLDNVVLARVGPDQTPARVRISLHGKDAANVTPEPGLRVMTTGHLSPPSGAVEPGGFDFQRHAWFARLGAVGYTRVPLLAAAPADQGRAGLAVFRLRMAASARIQSHLPGDIGGFAAALTTGDRSAMSQGALDALRASNLAHLLAISGLHMGILSGFVFGVLRLLLALHPHSALRWPTRSLAAGGALLVATGYLALSGGNVATERAYIMAAVALCALMLNRRAISLRGVAVAATIVLFLRPEALMGPGFQMSFAATTALVAVFGWMRDSPHRFGPRWIQPVLAVVISSAVAGFATAPIGAAHFNTIAQHGLLANLSSVPLMGVLVIPAAVLALVLAPFGLEWIGLWIMGLGLRWILGVAEWVAGLEGARSYVPGPGAWVLPLLALGFLILVLWQGRLRWGGLVAMALSVALWHEGARPAVLIADTGTLVGIMTPKGRALSKPKGAGFIARNWLENDGDASDQPDAAGKWQGGAIRVAGREVIHLSGKRAVAGLTRCARDQIIIASVVVEREIPGGCTLFDPKKLRDTGAIALHEAEGVLYIVTAREKAGARLWTPWR